jgi:hypothetical protein
MNERADMNLLGHISPVSDADAARAASRETLADLADQITRTPVTPAAGGARRPARRWLLAAIPAAAGATAGLLAFALAASGPAAPGPAATRPGPARASEPGPGDVQVMSFTTHGGYIDVIVRNPLADPRRYAAEFAAHHLHITISLVPASPSVVGTVVWMSESSGSNLMPITAVGRCWTGGGGNVCPVGVRVPLGYRGTANLVFGRAARPGEQYLSTGEVTAPGEAMHGLNFQGKTVAVVLAMLRARHVTVPQYRYMSARGSEGFTKVPGAWYVYDGVPWAPGQVLLFVGPTPAEPPIPAPSPVTPSPSPTGGG